MAHIAVIGTGYVGSVSGACLADFGNTVICTDTDAEKIAAFNRGEIPLYEPGLQAVLARNVQAGRLVFSTDIAGAVQKSDVVFIAVGTPPASDGSADLCFVESAARTIGAAIERYTVVVDKSTVPVGTGRRVRQWIAEELSRRGADVPFDVVSNPEFLREGSAVFDFTHPDRVVIGSESERARRLMKDVYRALYLTETPCIETNLESAELIKYASNAFLAIKITFINEIANLCEKVGANVQDVAKAVGRDGRIGAKFLHPGPGYGGSCFPKDTKALAKTGRGADCPVTLVETAMAANDAQKMRMVDKMEMALGGGGALAGKTAALLGLAFKQDTDDIRESPAAAIARELVRRGASVRVCDPEALDAARRELASLGDAVTFCADEYEAANGAQCCAIVTPWNQYRNLDLRRLKSLLASPFFFDLRNIYKRADAEAAGLVYFGVGT